MNHFFCMCVSYGRKHEIQVSVQSVILRLFSHTVCSVITVPSELFLVNYVVENACRSAKGMSSSIRKIAAFKYFVFLWIIQLTLSIYKYRNGYNLISNLRTEILCHILIYLFTFASSKIKKDCLVITWKVWTLNMSFFTLS